MPEVKSLIQITLLSNIKNTLVEPNAIYFLIGKDSIGDGKGGFYYWDAASVETEETTYLNVIQSNLTPTGRFKRVFSRTIILPHGVLNINSGIKSFYTTSSYSTDSNGECVVNLTIDNTTNGTPIFTEIWANIGQIKPPVTGGTSGNDTISGAVKNESANLKQATYSFTRGNNAIVSILGFNLLGLRSAPASTAVRVKVEGI